MFNRKMFLSVSLILNAVCLYTFTLTTQVYFLYGNRIIVGVFQVRNFLTISHSYQFIYQFGVINLEFKAKNL